MIFKITDTVSNRVVAELDADSGKTALEYFKLSHGMSAPYTITEEKGCWTMKNEYGSCFVAQAQ